MFLFKGKKGLKESIITLLGFVLQWLNPKLVNQFLIEIVTDLLSRISILIGKS
jgi:hypothetical protein